MQIKSQIRKRILSILSPSKFNEGEIIRNIPFKITSVDPRFGDYASNLAMETSRIFKKSSRLIAQEICDKLTQTDFPEFDKVNVAGPGFINFTLSSHFRSQALREVLSRRRFSKLRFPDLEKTYEGKKILLEYVSANPTGPLHIGHGRWAVIGSILSKILAITGAEVYEEFYVNDAGNQIQKFKDSVAAVKEGKIIPEDGYHGDYIQDLAKSTQDPVKNILLNQQQVLESIGVKMNHFYSEQSLYDDGLVEEMLVYLKKQGFAYKEDGAWWFSSTQTGDDKDRVLVRSNGEITYFGVDIAYHFSKFTRGYLHLIDVLGADHHGYVKRIASAVEVITSGKAHLDVVVGQLVTILREGKPIRMSKRSGVFIQLKEVVEEIGVDALRYFFSMRSPHMPLEFDLELAKVKSLENPVFYIQYSHARIASVKEKAHSLEIFPIEDEGFDFSLISNSTTTAIVNKLLEWEEEIYDISKSYELQHINNFLYDLSTLFHRYYNQEIFVSDKSEEEKQLSRHRLLFLEAVDQVIVEGLTILGISAPDKM